MLRSLILVLAIVGAYGQQNPCTEEVMRAPEIQLFANPADQASYLICTDVNTPISMPCSPGTAFDRNLRHCVPVGWEAPRCPVGTCFNNADCVIDELNQASCLCRVGFTGSRCEENIDECALEGNRVCQQAGGNCVDQVNAFYCEWNQGQEIGLSADKKISRPCSLTDLEAGKQFFELASQNGNVFLQCTGEWTFLVTKCADMLFWHQELRTCSIERPLEKTGVCRNYPCRNDGSCVDLGGNSFRCECKDGYKGDLCEEPIDFCLNKPCSNGGRCVSHPGGFNCVCQDLIVDQSCATGVQNPCGSSSGYLPNNVDATKYVSCSLGYGFVKSCAPGLKWNQEFYTCVLIEEVTAPTHQKPAYSAYDSYSSYATPAYVPQTTASYATPAYVPQTTASYATPAYAPPTTTSYATPATPAYAPQATPAYAPQTTASYTTQAPPAYVPPTTTSYATQAPPAYVPPTTTSYATPAAPSYAPQATPAYHQRPQQAAPAVPTYAQPPRVEVPQYQQRPQQAVPAVPTYSQPPRVEVPQYQQRPPVAPSYGQQPRIEAPQFQQRPQMPKAAPSFGSNHGSRMLSYFRQ